MREIISVMPPDPDPDPHRTSEIDATVPHSARIWNYWLGGKDNFPVAYGRRFPVAYERRRRMSWSARAGRSGAMRLGSAAYDIKYIFHNFFRFPPAPATCVEQGVTGLQTMIVPQVDQGWRLSFQPLSAVAAHADRQVGAAR
jgi:S-adenosyl methyltransferase